MDPENGTIDNGTSSNNMKWEMAKVGLKIQFRDLTIKFAQKKKNKSDTVIPYKYILNKVSGVIKPGRLAIIIGPSGSGKTSLLHCLAGRTRYMKGLSVSGIMHVNNHPINWKAYHRMIGYVEQEDFLFPQLTVRETLMLATQLRLSNKISHEEKEQYVNAIMADLGIIKVADSKIGDASLKSISGGEKRRASIAVELLASPSAIFCDEPTSGLDSNASLSVMQLLANLAHSGRSVVASVHQPRSAIFQLAQDLFLLSQGELAYFGPANDFLSFLESIGHPCPRHFNPADFAIDIVSVDYRNKEAENAARDRIRNLTSEYSTSMIKINSLKDNNNNNNNNDDLYAGTEVAASFVQGNNNENTDDGLDTKAAYPTSWCTQFGLLLVRAARNKFRSKQSLIGPLIASIIFGLVLGSLYFQLGYTQAAIQGRIGLLFFVTLNQSFNAMLPVLTTFGATERQIVYRERASKSYRVSAYWFSRNLVDVPFSVFAPWLLCIIVYFMVGLNPQVDRFFIFVSLITLAHFTSVSFGLVLAAGLSPSTSAAIGAPILLILMLFSGFYQNSALIPAPIAWIQWISPVRWTFAAVIWNEFNGVQFECDDSSTGCIPNGQAVITRLGFGNDSVIRSVVVLSSFIVFLQFAAYLVLKFSKPKYLAPANSNNNNNNTKTKSPSTKGSLTTPEKSNFVNENHQIENGEKKIVENGKEKKNSDSTTTGTDKNVEVITEMEIASV